MEIYSHPDIPEILSIPGNSNCCDCNVEKPKWASLNNGVFLCLKCAGVHRSLGLDFSTIRSLQIDSWTDKQILYLSKGGNTRFKNNLSEYKIDPDSPPELKYKCKASDYYRKFLKNEVEKTMEKDYKSIEIVKPSLEEGKELLDIKKGQEDVNNSNMIGNYKEQKKEEGLFSVFGNFINSVKQTVVDASGKITKEIDDLKIGEKIKEAGDKVVDYAKVSGNFIKDKSQQVYNSEIVQGITKKAESGINAVIEKTKVLLNNDANQQQNLNPNLLNKNEEQKNEELQMSNIIDNGMSNNNNDNNINNINDNNAILNSGEIKNEEIPKKEENKNVNNEEKPKEENKVENENKAESENKVEKENNIENKNESENKNENEKKVEDENGNNNKENNSNENPNNDKEKNVVDDKKVEEESVKKENESSENPQNP